MDHLFSVKSFVTPFPDETPFSMLSRYYVLYSPAAATTLLNIFFGSKARKITGPLPKGLDHFYRVAPSGLWRNLEDFLNRHTLLPYYRPFLNLRAAKKLAALPEKLELTTSNLPSSILSAKTLVIPKFCPVCVREDIELRGQPYWRRTHQVPGVLVCHNHHVRLIDCCPECGGSGLYGSRLYLPKLKCECGCEFIRVVPSNDPIEPWQERAAAVARFCGDLLDAKLEPVVPSLLSSFYWETLRDRGYFRRGSRNKFQLWMDFVEYFTPNMLGKMGLPVPAGKCADWFADVTFRSPKCIRHPLYHVLLLSFLFHKFEAFRSALAEFKMASGKIKSPRERSRNLTWDVRDPKLFEILRTLLLDEKRSFRFVQKTLGISKLRLQVAVRSAGILAQLRSEEYLEKDAAIVQDLLAGMSYADVRKKHGVGRVRVEQLCGGRPDLAESRCAKRCADTLQKHKDRLVQFMAHEPSAACTRLRKEYPDSYKYVRRHDKPWFDEHLPQENGYLTPSNGMRTLDYDKRDVEVELKLRAVVEQLRHSPVRPVRLTKTGLLSMAGVMSKAYMYLEHLPRTRKILKELIDTDESFNRRKIAWAIRELSKEGLLITKGAVAKKIFICKKKHGYLIDEAFDANHVKKTASLSAAENVTI